MCVWWGYFGEEKVWYMCDVIFLCIGYNIGSEKLVCVVVWLVLCLGSVWYVVYVEIFVLYCLLEKKCWVIFSVLCLVQELGVEMVIFFDLVEEKAVVCYVCEYNFGKIIFGCLVLCCWWCWEMFVD